MLVEGLLWLIKRVQQIEKNIARDTLTTSVFGHRLVGSVDQQHPSEFQYQSLPWLRKQSRLHALPRERHRRVRPNDLRLPVLQLLLPP